MASFHEALEEFKDEKNAKEEAIFRAKTERLTLLQNKAELLSAFVRSEPDFVEYLKCAMNGKQDLVLAETTFGKQLVDGEIRGRLCLSRACAS